jgi:hypothetical protein
MGRQHRPEAFPIVKPKNLRKQWVAFVDPHTLKVPTSHNRGRGNLNKARIHKAMYQPAFEQTPCRPSMILAKFPQARSIRLNQAIFQFLECLVSLDGVGERRLQVLNLSFKLP